MTITNIKISNKFIPRTYSHTTNRIKHMLNKIEHKTNQNIKKNTNTNTNTKPILNFKVYKQNYFNKLRDISTTSTSTTNTSTTNKYIIVIPSYNRPELIQKKTLAVLQKHNIDSTLINIFVSDKEQYDLYKEQVPSSLYNELIIGVKGLKNQRNYINKYYPEGYHIVQMDDDIDKIVQLVVTSRETSRKKSSITSKSRTKSRTKSRSKSLSRKTLVIHKSFKPIDNLDKFIKEAFLTCESNGIFLWGVYPLANAYFMTDTITTDLRFIVGPMFGMINRHRADLQLTLDEKENSERTLQHWVIDGKVLRFNNIGIETNYYKNKGGMQNEGKNRKEEALKSITYLHNKYPSITKIHLSKKSGMPEIKLIRYKK